MPAQSREPDKTLKLFFGHTGERGEFTFKRNGRYDRAELAKLNHFLRDWRKGEDAHMDPQLLDLVWAIYQESGSHDYIHVVSAYRSPATNEMLRKRSSGVAKNSQHRLGKAMDWFVTDVQLSKLREVAMKMQGGGVGYYPRSGSPFVHTDTGNVRAWPRMSRQQLIALFPNGNTLHLPADGKPLPGYEQAVARRQAQGGTALAYLETGADEGDSDSATAATATAAAAGADRTGTENTGTKSWLARVFPGDEADDTATTASAAPGAAPANEQVAVAAVGDEAFDARVPRPRPLSDADAEDLPAPIQLASADVAAVGFLVMPALGTGAAIPGAESYGLGAQTPQQATDAIATLITPESTLPQDGGRAALAYAPANDAVGPKVSDADRAILAAFSAVDQSNAVSEADAALIAALTRQSLGDAGDVAAAEEETVQEPRAVIVAAADLAGYEDDEDVLLDLIEASAPADPKVAHLAMPKPQNEEALFVAPSNSAAVADLRGDAGPPVDRFTPAAAGEGHSNQGFFTKLFASLIE